MFKALVLVRNFASQADRLNFKEFNIGVVGLGFKEFREVFSSFDINQDDWIFEKIYHELPPGPPGSPVGGIPNDIEDVLLLLRLFKPGDVSFVKQVIIPPNGKNLVQFPYGAVNDLNSYSSARFDAQLEDCESWQAFAASIRRSESWRSAWFSAARRFFLSGGAKQFNPQWDEVDRIVDYATALEATLVPEKDYSTRRISRRAAALLAPENSGEAEVIAKFLRKFYGIRSQIVHGSGLGSENRTWLAANFLQIEIQVRQILTAAVRVLPPEEDKRRIFLSRLYDPTDEDRGCIALDKFKEIKDEAVRKAIAAKIVRIAGG